MKKTIKLSLTCAALFTSVYAQEVELKPLYITSTAIQTDELRSSDAVEIYTAEDIEKAHVQDLYEFLNLQTSVITMPSYGNPFSQKMDMRGYGIGDGYQNIVITINGRKMNNIDMTSQLLSSISPSSIEKIEIIKSSGIVSGGDGANAGVINITTKRSNDKTLTLYGGIYNTYDGGFYLGHNEDGVAISFSGEAQKNGGIRDIDANGNKDENKFSTFDLNLAYTAIEDLELRLDARTTKTDVIYAGYLTKAEYEENPRQAGATNWGSTHQKYKSNVITLGGTYFIMNNLEFNIDASREKKESNYITYSSINNYEYDSLNSTLKYYTKNFSLVGGVDMFDGLRLSGGDTSKKNIAGFINTSANFNASSVKLAYRYEKVSYKHKDISTNIKQDDKLYGLEFGLNQMLNKKNSIFLNYSHGYQAPDIDRFFTTTYPAPTYAATIGFNTFIDPMESDTLTLGYNNITGSNKLKLSIFYAELEDEIYYYSDPTYVSSKNTNIDESHKYGLDIYDKYILSDKWNLSLNYNYVKAMIDKEIENGENYSDKELPGVSKHNIKASISYLPSKNSNVTLSQVYRSEAYAANDFSNNFIQKQDAYNSTNIAATYAKDNFELFAKINNLFNQKNALWIKDDAIYPLNYTTTAIAGLKLKY